MLSPPDFRAASPLADLLSASKHFLIHRVGLSTQHSESAQQNSSSSALLMKPKDITRKSRGKGVVGRGTAYAEPFSQEDQALKSWDQGASYGPSSPEVCNNPVSRIFQNLMSSCVK